MDGMSEVQRFVFHGDQKIPVVVHPSLEPWQWKYINGNLFVGKGMDIDQLLFKLNCTPYDSWFLRSIKVEAP